MHFQITEDETDSLTLGLIRKAIPLDDILFFFKINSLSSFNFYRSKDLEIYTPHHRAVFPVWHSPNNATSPGVKFFGNKAILHDQHTDFQELFVQDADVTLLLNSYAEVDFITCWDNQDPDYSLLLLPNSLTFPVQEKLITIQHDLYNTLEYYEG